MLSRSEPFNDRRFYAWQFYRSTLKSMKRVCDKLCWVEPTDELREHQVLGLQKFRLILIYFCHKVNFQETKIT